MSQPGASQTLVINREMPHPPEKVWRALTEGPLIAEWLMRNDFEPVVGHIFNLNADWGSVECQVLAVEPNRMLAYSWAAFGLNSVVTWTLTPSSTGTHLRMEQTGFQSKDDANYQGATYGWQKFLGSLETVVASME